MKVFLMKEKLSFTLIVEGHAPFCSKKLLSDIKIEVKQKIKIKQENVTSRVS